MRPSQSRSVSSDGPFSRSGIASDKLAVVGSRDLLLKSHQLALAVLDRTAVDLVFQVVSLRGIFVGETEDTEPVELRCLHELHQLFEIGFGLAREIRQ